jgi:bifunctional non-homologous end joining protein LigD
MKSSMTDTGLLIIERRKVHAYTRNGFDWTERYPGITKVAAKLGCRSAIIDGEVIVQNERGGLRFWSAEISDPVASTKPDLLRFWSSSFERQGSPKRAVAGAKGQIKRAYSDWTPLPLQWRVHRDAAAFFRACADHQLEGIVSKLASSKYRSGRSKTWLKTKCFTWKLFAYHRHRVWSKDKSSLALLARADAKGLA